VTVHADAKPAKAERRLESVDLVRGIVIVLMTLDHVRDFVAVERFDFGNPAVTTPLHFATRWVTHLCAPAFVFIAGTSAFLSSGRRTARELSAHLATRGLWLIAVELTLVAYAWWLSVPQRVTLQVIWAIGVSMLVLAILVHFPRRVSIAFGVVLIAGHNALDGFSATGNSAAAVTWRILHQLDAFEVAGQTVVTLYPLVPWIGVMALGYGLGPMVRDRPRQTFRLGLLVTLGFVVLRLVDVYGDPNPWSATRGPQFAVMSFLNTTKYPPSLLFVMMTLGPTLMFLGRVRTAPAALRWLLTFGSVPLFYYLAHLYLGHALAVVIGVAQGFSAGQIMTAYSEYPAGFGVPLWGIYAVAGLTVVMLYPACRWFSLLKATRRHRLLSYL